MPAPGHGADDRHAGVRKIMNRFAQASVALAIFCSSAMAADRPPRFWNLTLYTITEFYLAPSGTTNWGENQCKNDKDGTVEVDERVRITGVDPGIYDARLKDISGRTCLARNIKVEAGQVFPVEEKDLTACDH
jgi:hypothetical protein